MLTSRYLRSALSLGTSPRAVRLKVLKDVSQATDPGVASRYTAGLHAPWYTYPYGQGGRCSVRVTRASTGELPQQEELLYNHLFAVFSSPFVAMVGSVLVIS